MTVGLMRKMDFWLGIPVCFFLSVARGVQKFFRREALLDAAVNKVLFLELSEIGSTILAYPAMRKVKEFYPESELFFWIFSENQDAVHVLGTVPRGNVLTVRTDSLWSFFLDIFRNLKRIHREHIDVVVDMELFSRFSSILSFLTGARFRIGFGTFAQEGLYRGDLRTQDVPYNPYKHISQNYLALVYALKAPEGQQPCVKEPWPAAETALTLPVIESSPDRQKKILDILHAENPQIDRCRKRVVIHPGIHEALPLRQWPLSSYLELAEKLSADPAVSVIYAGVAAEKANAGLYNQLRGERAVNLIGKTRIPDLIDLFNFADLLISHDGGMIHIAALTRIPIIAIFGPETPDLYGPLKTNKTIFYSAFSCSPCLTAYNHRVSRCNANLCVRAVSVQAVYQSALKFLNR